MTGISTKFTSFIPVIMAAALCACGPAAVSPGPESAGDKEFIDVPVSYIETAGNGTQKHPLKKVPMPEIEAAFDYKFPDVSKKKLGNGFRVFHVAHSRLPLVSVEIVFRAGSAHDPSGLPGLAVFTGEMLKGGTNSRSSKQIAEDFEKLGTSLYVWTDYDTTTVTITCLKEHFETMMELLSDIVLYPTFPEDEIEIFRTRELGRLKLEKSDPNWLARKEFATLAYGSHPYSRYDTTEESIRKITKKDIEKFHGRAYCASNGFATIVGDVDFEQAHKTVAGFFKKMPKGKPLKLKKAKIPKADKTKIVIIDRPGSVQTVFKIGAVAIERRSSDYIPMKVANHILGGSASSRLFLRVREKESNAYSVWSRITRTIAKGTWNVSGSTRTEATAKALASIFDEIEKIGNKKAGGKELDEAISYLTGSFALKIETTGQVAVHVSDMAVFGLPDDYWDVYLNAMGKVTTEEVKSMGITYLDPEKLLVVLVGDAKQLKKLLSDYENVTVKTQYDSTIKGGYHE